MSLGISLVLLGMLFGTPFVIWLIEAAKIEDEKARRQANACCGGCSCDGGCTACDTPTGKVAEEPLPTIKWQGLKIAAVVPAIILIMTGIGLCNK